MKHKLLAFFLVAFAAAPSQTIQRLEREMAGLAQGAGGVAGACAIHIETGRRAFFNPKERFPMASTYKVPIARLIADWGGVATLPPEGEWSPEVFQKLLRAVPPEQKKAAAARFDADPRDTATPEAMADLLVRVHRKDALASGAAELLLDIMRRCRTGQARLKGILPAGAEVAHKTGSIDGATNDVGIVTLPDNAGHVAIAVFVKASEKETPARERAIAEIARAVHDFFHWSAGSVRPDGLAGEHSAALDAVYQAALDIDYQALSAAQDRAIALLGSGTVRVRTPAGTDLRFRLGRRPFNEQDGDASAERAQAARVRVDREIELPAGVLRVAPLEETAEGRIVIPEARFGDQVACGVRLRPPDLVNTKGSSSVCRVSR